MDFEAITLATGGHEDDLGNPIINTAVTGDLTRYGTHGLRISVDVRTFQLNNFFFEPMNPHWFPLTLELTDYTDNGPVSVYLTAHTMPAIEDGWTRISYDIPDPTQAALPAGWGGTGAEDPTTFAPILPPDRTYTSVLQNVDRLSISTFQPGFFYSANFWEAGFDNLRIEVIGDTFACNDFNQDGSVDPDDLGDFINCYFLPGCDRADFNHDDNVNPDDLGDFINAYFGGC